LELLPVKSTEPTYSDMHLNLITKFTANAMDTKHYFALLCIIIICSHKDSEPPSQKDIEPDSPKCGCLTNWVNISHESVH